MSKWENEMCAAFSAFTTLELKPHCGALGDPFMKSMTSADAMSASMRSVSVFSLEGAAAASASTLSIKTAGCAPSAVSTTLAF